MADYLIKGETLTGIADAIRSKTGSSAPVAVSSMASQIAGITGGGGGDVTLLEGMSFELDFSNGDMPFAAPAGYAVKSAIVKKPATLTPENVAAGVEIAGIVGTHAGGGGGGSVAGCVTVTFKNGNTTLFSRPVYIGDDCPDPIAQGRFATPTKASTAQYDYTYYGWGASDGGAADANILKNITADKTVYAIYTAAVRSYTITYYDEDGTTVLKTQQVAYGTVPSYTPTKSGYVFDGWTTELVAVTGDASYVATWSEKLTFAGATWGDIARISEAGDAQKHFALGNTRVINVDGVDVTFQIVGFDHDDLADGSGKAGISCVAKTTMGRQVQFASDTNKLYNGSILDSTVNGYLSTLEPELQAVIKSVKKAADNVTYKSQQEANAATKSMLSRKLWVPSTTEMSAYIYGAWTATTLGTKYAYMDGKTASKYPSTSIYYWVRNMSYQQMTSTKATQMYGYSTVCNKDQTQTADVLIGFCI